MGSRDATALQVLHDEHASDLWRYVVRLTHDRDRAEDIVQETLLRAWRSDIRDGPDRPARAWLFTVARNLVIDESRSARRRHEVDAAALPERAVADRTDALFDSLLVTEALHALRPEHRSVVIKAYFGRLTVAEIAADLGIPRGTVKSRLHYGLRALRLALQEKGVTQ